MKKGTDDIKNLSCHSI